METKTMTNVFDGVDTKYILRDDDTGMAYRRLNESHKWLPYASFNDSLLCVEGALRNRYLHVNDIDPCWKLVNHEGTLYITLANDMDMMAWKLAQ